MATLFSKKIMIAQIKIFSSIGLVLLAGIISNFPGHSISTFHLLKLVGQFTLIYLISHLIYELWKLSVTRDTFSVGKNWDLKIADLVSSLLIKFPHQKNKA